MRLVIFVDSITRMLRFIASDSVVICASPSLVSHAELLYHFSILRIAAGTTHIRHQDAWFAPSAGLGVARNSAQMTVLMGLGVFRRSHASELE